MRVIPNSRKIVSGVTLTLLLIGMLTLAFEVQPAKSDWAWTETIFIRTDGSVDPDTTPLSSIDNVTYTLTDHIVGNIPALSSAVRIERDNIVFNGAGYIVQGTWTSYSNGISLSGRSNVTIKNMHVKKFYYGIHLYGSTNCRIENVTATNNGYGIALSWGSNQNILSHNNATNNSYGIYIEHSNNNSITSNTIANGRLSGICLWDASNNILFGNIVSSSRYGIELWAYGSYGNILSGNIVSSSNVDGIVLNGADNNTLSGNIISSNGQYGITLMADNNIIYGNTIANNSGYYWSSGIYFGWTCNNIISSNTIKNNNGGIFLYGEGENNKIFHNNFINNTNQVYVSSEHSNIWDDGYPSGGNYWSDYTIRYPDAYELDDSGIWDTPYIIDENNRDHYPLMNPVVPDVAVVSVVPSATEVYVGWKVDITVVVKNEGKIAETFTVKCKYELEGVEQGIGTQTVTNLAPKANTTLTFTWTTTDVTVHTIKAEATILPGETDTADNTMTSPVTVKVKLLGDVNGDNKVDIRDIAQAGLAFGSYPNHPRWNTQADVYQDGKVDIRDMALIAKNFGETYP